MTLRAFLRTYRAQIDAVIRFEAPHGPRLNDRERRLWILNHAGLYELARDFGVKL